MVTGSSVSAASTVAITSTAEWVRASDSDTRVPENSAAHSHMMSTLCR
jgi:hypothetical protein